MLRLVVLFALLANPLFAGAWPRGQGNGFASVSFQLTDRDFLPPVNTYTALYLEYGVTDKITLGLDTGRGVSGKNKTILFASHPLLSTNNGHKFGVDLGFGYLAGEPAIRPGLSYGKGFSTDKGSGWVAVDTVMEYTLTTGRVDLKSDITFGLSYHPTMKTILQLQTGISALDPPFARFAPSFVFKTGEQTNIEVGLAVGLVGDNNYGFKVGMWRDF
ncbi:hypothetical protein DI396_07455 [Litorivita pollutaquae]|uniref:Transporter n=1 Tax=Litorivita pollutaquae TaxID=2200892 RepID=A0A2V4MMI6_9RHOB|nr:hypothetical protein [Litorivita pollutaquae]PYC47915.1 hypothetical protein DI396_07455 [Litorivita pollutaquae]